MRDQNRCRSVNTVSVSNLKSRHQGIQKLWYTKFQISHEVIQRVNCTQNSGIVVMAMMTSYASLYDTDLRERVITYYGVIKDIIELSFNKGAGRSFCFSVTRLITTRIKQTNMASHLLTLQGQIRKLVLSFYLLWYCKHSSCRIHLISLRCCLLSQKRYIWFKYRRWMLGGSAHPNRS